MISEDNKDINSIMLHTFSQEKMQSETVIAHVKYIIRLNNTTVKLIACYHRYDVKLDW